MNYEKIYNNLIQKALSENRKKLKRYDINYVYYEKHHIIPKCISGTNNEENLVLLTAREHFIVHKLLVEIHPKERKLWFALHRMTYSNNQHHKRDYKISSYEYERIRTNHSKNLIGDKNPMANTKMKGKDHPMYGKNHSEESLNKISENHADVSGDKNPNYGKTGIKSHMYNRFIGEKNPMFDKTIYKFYHNEFGVEECTRNYLVNKYNLSRQYVRVLCKNQINNYRGWSLIK